MMKLDSTLLGRLVRPRVLAYTFDENKYFSLKESKPNLLLLRRKQVEYLVETHDKPLHKVFDGIDLGDTSKDTSTAYCAQVTSLIAYLHRTNNYKVYRIKEQIASLESKLEKRGDHKTITIVAIGVRFYKGFDSTGPKNPWLHHYEFFYDPHELLPLEHIMLYESCKATDYILLPKGCGIVVNNVKLNKYRWYKTGSWTCHKVMLLSGTDERLFKLLPSRKFMIKRQGVHGLLGIPFVNSSGEFQTFPSLYPSPIPTNKCI